MAALNPIPNFIMNGTQVVNAPAMPPMGSLSSHVVCLVGTAPSKHDDVPFNECIKIDSYAHAMKLLNTDNGYLGTLPAALEYILTRVDVRMYVVVVDAGANDTETLQNIIGGVDGATGEATGIYKIPECFEQATLIYAPSVTDVALGQKLSQVADQVKAIPVMDAPNTNKQQAAECSGNFGGIGTVEENLCLAFPAGLYDLNNGAGTGVMGSGCRLIAALAAVELWQSPQNQIDGCQENTIPVGYNPSSETSDHNFLNKYGVFTFCHSPNGGIVTMGNRCHAGKFVSKAGLECALARKIVETSEIYKGKAIAKPFVEALVTRLNSWIKTLVNVDQCIIDAKVQITEMNSADTYRSGSFYIAINYGDFSPLEHFHVTLAEDVTIVERYVEELKKL